MGVKGDFTGASILGKVTFILLLVANFFNWIAFCTTEWGLKYNGVYYQTYGIWRICTNNDLSSGCSRTDGWALNWYGAVQGFAIFGFLGINVACIILVLTMFVSKFKKNAEAGMAAAIICFVAAFCYLIAVIIFGARFDNTYLASNINTNFAYLASYIKPDFGYSFALAIISLILAAIGGVLIIVEAKKGSGTSPT